MLLDEAASQLFFAVLPAFIASLPRPVLVSEDQVRCSGTTPGSIQTQLAVDIAIVRLRQAIHDLPKRFNPARSAQHLTNDACMEAADALDEMLYAMDRLVGAGILDNRASEQAETFEKLSALRDLVGDSPWPGLEEEPAVPLEALTWVTYLQHENQNTEAVQYRRITKQADRFNDTMRRLFDPEYTNTVPTAACLMGSSRPSQEINTEERDREALLTARNLSAFTRSLSSLIPRLSLESWRPPHGAMIHLNGFDQLELDTLITLCGTNKAEEWHAITWVARDPAARTVQSTIRDKIRESRRLNTRLTVHVGTDGLWSGTNSERMGHVAEKPSLTLDSALYPEKGPLLRKKERLNLAVNIARSFFCLIWSPLVCSPWNSATIHIPDPRGQSQTVKPYIEGRLHFQDPDPESKSDCKIRRPLLLDIGVLLWEILFSRKIVVNSEDGRGEGRDEDDGDESDEDLIFNALDREQRAARESCFDQICLAIIGNCLDLYVVSHDEADSAQIQRDIYYKIVRPLWDYVEAYDESISSVSSLSCIPSPLPKQRHIQLTKRSSPSACLPPAKRLRPAVLGDMAVPKKPQPPPTSTTSAKAALLASNQTVSPGNRTVYGEPALTLHPKPQISSSAHWLQRFDTLKQHLQDTKVLSFPVKIAILDTGCDIENDFFAGPGIDYIDSVEANWTDYVDGKALPCDEDPGRHGTALSALLLRLIPNSASIHVARVARNADELMEGKENTAKAIMGAIRWGAHIICMSFGFGTESRDIKDTIVQAEMVRQGRIIFFAASNNDGLNESELFPAELENVVSVRGTLYDGRFHQKYNPGSWGHKRGHREYGTLGVDVRCAWTTDDLTKSGCSVATPIMAAIAAMVISYVRTSQDLDASEQDVVWTRRGILSVFFEMAEPHNQTGTDRLYLAPWFLFDGRSPIHLLGHALSKVPRVDPSP